jgi:hypothetical protein
MGNNHLYLCTYSLDANNYVTLYHDPVDDRFKMQAVEAGVPGKTIIASAPRWLHRGAIVKCAVRYSQGNLRLSISDGIPVEHVPDPLPLNSIALTGPPISIRTGDPTGENVLPQILFDDVLYYSALSDSRIAELMAVPNLAAAPPACDSPVSVPAIHSLAVFDDGRGLALYAGTSATDSGGAPAGNVLRWDGQNWSNVGDSFNGEVDAMCAINGATGPALLAGGVFTAAGATPASGLAQWTDSGWQPLSGQIGGFVDALLFFQDRLGPALFAGGTFPSSPGGPPDGVVRCSFVSNAADFNYDGRVDQADLDYLQHCVTGPSIPQLDVSCFNADLDADGDVDQDDFAVFQRAYTGGLPGTAP